MVRPGALLRHCPSLVVALFSLTTPDRFLRIAAAALLSSSVSAVFDNLGFRSLGAILPLPATASLGLASMQLLGSNTVYSIAWIIAIAEILVYLVAGAHWVRLAVYLSDRLADVINTSPSLGKALVLLSATLAYAGASSLLYLAGVAALSKETAMAFGMLVCALLVLTVWCVYDEETIISTPALVSLFVSWCFYLAATHGGVPASPAAPSAWLSWTVWTDLATWTSLLQGTGSAALLGWPPRVLSEIASWRCLASIVIAGTGVLAAAWRLDADADRDGIPCDQVEDDMTDDEADDVRWRRLVRPWTAFLLLLLVLREVTRPIDLGYGIGVPGFSPAACVVAALASILVLGVRLFRGSADPDGDRFKLD